MSGDATFAGTTYQAGVIAYVAVHAITQQRLGWFDFMDDTPQAIAAEVGGPGDDILIEFLGAGTSNAEVQAKHGLSGSGEILKFVARIQSSSGMPGSAGPVVLAVDESSAKWIRDILASDLDRLRAGRINSCRQRTQEIIEASQDRAAWLTALSRLHVKVVDVDEADDSSAKWALSELRRALKHSDRAEDAWRLLCHDAEKMCRNRSRRSRSNLLQLFTANGLTLVPPGPLGRIAATLDLSRSLLQKHKPHAALDLLKEIEDLIEPVKPAPEAQYRLYQQRGAAYLQMGRSETSLSLAKTALEFDPQGVHALNTATLSASNIGDGVAAGRYSTQALKAAPHDASAWAIAALVSLRNGGPVEAPPPSVAETTEYRRGLIDALMHVGKTDEAVPLIDELLRQGHRNPDVLLSKARALVVTENGEASIRPGDVAAEVERLTTEVIEECDAPDDALRDALLARTFARRALNRHTDAQADTDRAYELDPDEPDVLSNAAQTKMTDGDFEGARLLLTRPTVERYPFLIALRAQALAGLKDVSGAKRDIEEAVRRLSQAYEPNAVRVAVADAAIEVGDSALAEQMLASVSGPKSQSVSAALLRGRLEFSRGSIEQAIAAFEIAAQRDEKLRAACYAELGSRLLSAGRSAAAVQAFEKSEPLPAKALPQYVRALILETRLAAAQKLIEPELARGDAASGWALEAATHLSILSEDFSTAASYLERLIRRGGTPPSARLQLTSLHIEAGKMSEAREVLATLLDEIESLDPEDQMGVARGLFALGDEDRALQLAFRAFRLSENNPEAHRSFATLALRARTPLPEVSEVGVDTFVALTNTRTGQSKEFVILGAPPFNPAANQISKQAAEALNLLGLRLGDLAPLKDPLDKWKVVAIKPALLHTVQDVVAHFEDRFPDAPFFVKGFSIGGGTGVADFAGVISTLHEGNDHRQRVVRLYREHVLPLGFVSSSSGATIEAAMEYLRSEETGGLLLVEWSNFEGQQQSISSATRAVEVILTESALVTAQHLEMLAALRDRFTLVAPRSLHSALAERLRECEEMVREGRRLLSTEGPGLRMHEWSAGDPALVAARDRIQLLLRWVEENATLEPRPLESLETGENSTRQAIGDSSFDSLALAVHRACPLYADDLGLRRLAQAGGTSSFSTPTLIASLGESGHFTGDAMTEMLLRLVRMHYAWVPLSPSLLNRVLVAMAGDDLTRAVAVNLGPTTFNLESASRLGAQAIRLAAASAIQTRSLTLMTTALLSAMNVHWPRHACAHGLARAAADELRLLPRQSDIIIRVCREYAKRSDSFPSEPSIRQ